MTKSCQERGFRREEHKLSLIEFDLCVQPASSSSSVMSAAALSDHSTLQELKQLQTVVHGCRFVIGGFT